LLNNFLKSLTACIR